MNPQTLGAVVARFNAAPLRARLHIWGRLRSFPVDAVLDALPAEGHFVSIGCGHAATEIAALLRHPKLQCTALDPDGAKLAHTRRAAADLPLTVIEGVVPPPGPFDAALIVDVLYLLTPAETAALFAALQCALRPGSRLVLKEMDTKPRTKYLWNRMQEFLALRVFRLTRHRHGACGLRPAHELVGELDQAGFQVLRSESLHGGWLHPHHLIVAVRR
jgi:2-polyprenyl-6-hydroxyphenyl methylase/3-demethylubiquinone-9 3-methyltransferase